MGVFYWTCCCYCCSNCCCCFGCCCCCFWCWSNNICTHFERGWGQLRGARVWWPSSFVGCAISFFYSELPSFSLPTLELYSCPTPLPSSSFFSFTILPAFVLIFLRFLRSLSFAAVATAHGKWNENRMILINLINRGAQPTAQLTIYSTLIVLYTRFQLVQSPPLLCFRFCFDSLRFSFISFLLLLFNNAWRFYKWPRCKWKKVDLWSCPGLPCPTPALTCILQSQLCARWFLFSSSSLTASSSASSTSSPSSFASAEFLLNF